MTISKKPTENVTCTATVCSATAAKAVLNARDLARLLKKNDVSVVPGAQAKDIVVSAPLHWTSAHRLTLDAFTSISINRTIAVEGSGALTLTTNDGGSGGDYGFGAKGNIEFWDTSDGLTINGTVFTLAADLPTLISDISGHASGAFALAKSYDASVDGTYSRAPIQASFGGTFEGLGNAIQNLSIEDNATISNAALFNTITGAGVLRDISLVNVSTSGAANTAGGLVGVSNGTIQGVRVSGVVQSTTVSGDIGGIAAALAGTLTNSSSDVTVQSGDGTGNLFVGGLVGEMFGGHASLSFSVFAGAAATGKGVTAGGLVGGSEDSGDSIQQSFSTGSVTTAASSASGGLVGLSQGSVTECFATGTVTGGRAVSAGGLIGENRGVVSQSYSTGPVSGDVASSIGGLIGGDQAPSGDITNSYWDLETSGVSDPSKGAGNRNNDPGITGLTTAQFQSGLPAGFDPSVWGESAKINNGFPYLRALRGPN